jgi:hypothetical protein
VGLAVTLAWRRGALDAPAPPADEESLQLPKAAAGLVLILVYGWSLP